jgi:hypothetical protein
MTKGVRHRPSPTNRGPVLVFRHFIYDGGHRLQKLYVKVKLPQLVLRDLELHGYDPIELNSQDSSLHRNKYIVKLKLSPSLLRTLPPVEPHQQCDSSELDSLSDEEILNLDKQLNDVLAGNAAVQANSDKLLSVSSSQVSGRYKVSRLESQPQALSPPQKKMSGRQSKASSQPADNYRAIPTNIVPILSRELHQFKDDDFGMVDRIVFSLNDPLTATKIKLPVKSVKCIHFECFDFENFCIFNKIPQGIQFFTKKEMIKKNFDTLKGNVGAIRPQRVTRLVKPEEDDDFVKIIDNPTPYKTKYVVPKVPVYRCPFCDQEFHLNQLRVLDSFNYFVKATPKETSRVELLNMNKYRIIDDTFHLNQVRNDQEEEFIVLSDDEEENTQSTTQKLSSTGGNTTTIDRQEELDDGLDEELLRMSSIYEGTGTGTGSGSGSWDDPIEL